MRPPVFFICGAFGAGKSTLAPLLARRLVQCCVLDTDRLMQPLVNLSGIDLFSEPESWPALRTLWLTIASINAAGGRSTVLLSPSEPNEIESLPLPRDLGEFHWLLLDCDDDELQAATSEVAAVGRNSDHRVASRRRQAQNTWAGFGAHR